MNLNSSVKWHLGTQTTGHCLLNTINNILQGGLDCYSFDIHGILYLCFDFEC